MRVRCLTTGAVRAKAGERGVRRYVVDRWRETALPVHAFLVEHPDGLCLFDAGQSARATTRGYLPQWHPFLRLSRFELGLEDEVAAQLRRDGIEPGDVRRVVLSHLHTDHIGGLEPFRGAETIVVCGEWERGTGLGGRARGYVPQHWPAGLEPRLVDLDGPAVGPFSGSYDVAGDGRLLLVATPGHTPHHASLLVRGDGAAWLLGGDMAHTFAELEAAYPAAAAFCRDEDVVFLAAHDPDAPALAGRSGATMLDEGEGEEGA